MFIIPNHRIYFSHTVVSLFIYKTFQTNLMYTLFYLAQCQHEQNNSPIFLGKMNLSHPKMCSLETLQSQKKCIISSNRIHLHTGNNHFDSMKKITHK